MAAEDAVENNTTSSGKKRKSPGGSNGFKSLGLSDSVYRGIVRMGFNNPTPVQRKSIPIVLTGVDTVVMARTGSGKTCAFLIPLIEKLLATPKGLHGNHVRGVILSPTRELSMQTLKVLNKLLADGEDEHNIKAVGIHGAESLERQFNLLASKPDVIVATPGRLAHLLSEIPDFALSGCAMCILDEADRLLEMGFAAQIRQIGRSLPENCQKVLLSATMPKILIEFTKSGFAVDPTVVRLDQEATVSDELRIAFITCRSMEKDAALLHILDHIKKDKEEHASTRTGLTLIFAATRHHVEYVTTLLKASGIAVTLIYGSLDQEARKSNLAAFRSGKNSVLVVTDVAARGIDVPLIDHVIHYHFPPSPKLFVHRSGRAARAGRIGFCWGLVEPDELPYMMDLHLFLGRRPSTGESTDASSVDQELMYTLDEMSPEMVHYGSVPESILMDEVENVQRIMSSELSGSIDADTLRSLSKVCTNAMKQYRRTRIEASREAVRRAKAILEGERLETGQRLSKGAIPSHPLLRGLERERLNNPKYTKQGKDGLATLENVRKREDFLREMSMFRPKETVFEAFATGGGKEMGVASHVDRGRTVTAKHHRKNDPSAALSAMKDMRRQMRMARDKGSTLVVAGSANALEINQEDAAPSREVEDEEEGLDQIHPSLKSGLAKYELDAAPVVGKRRISKAERRRLKKNGPEDSSSRDMTDSAAAEEPEAGPKVKTAADFRDPIYYMDHNFSANREEVERSRQIEAAMQPSASTAARGVQGAALRMEEVMLDLVGDENEELVKKQRLMRWDKSKRKYVSTTVGDELSGESKTKKMRLENGQLVKNDKAKLGELYAKWQKKTNRSVGRSGVFDDDDDGHHHDVDGAVGGGRARSRSSARRSPGLKKPGARDSDEVKTAQEIKKDRSKKQDNRMKNTKKSARRFIERKGGPSARPGQVGNGRPRG